MEHFVSLEFWHFSVLPQRECIKEVVTIGHSSVFTQITRSIFLFIEGFCFLFCDMYMTEVTRAGTTFRRGREPV